MNTCEYTQLDYLTLLLNASNTNLKLSGIVEDNWQHRTTKRRKKYLQPAFEANTSNEMVQLGLGNRQAPTGTTFPKWVEIGTTRTSLSCGFKS